MIKIKGIKLINILFASTPGITAGASQTITCYLTALNHLQVHLMHRKRLLDVIVLQKWSSPSKIVTL